MKPDAEDCPENVAFAVRAEVFTRVFDVAFPTNQSLDCNVSVHSSDMKLIMGDSPTKVIAEVMMCKRQESV